jgi:hypothetical protein
MTQIPHAEPGFICPLHKVDMELVCHKCAWWTKVVGKHPQTGENVDQWQCAIATLPMLLVQNAQQTRQAGAVMQAFRNDVVQGAAQRRAIDARNNHRQ